MSEQPLTVKEAAQRLRVSGRTAYEMFRRGALDGYRVYGDSGTIRIYESSVEEYLTRKPRPAVPAEPPKAERPAKAGKPKARSGSIKDLFQCS